MTDRPDIVIILTDEERAAPPYEDPAVARWRHETLAGERWFAEHGVAFARHYTGSLACVTLAWSALLGVVRVKRSWPEA